MGNKEIIEFTRENIKISISLKEDHYGREFWENFANWKYEPDTQTLVKAFCGPETLFIDVGAAYGSLSFSASAYGAKVWSFEPNPKVFQGLVRNISLNPELAKRIEAINCAISDESSYLSISNQSNNQILSPIVFTSWESRTQVEVRSLGDVLENASKVNHDVNSDLLIKMDIEGAEWKILANKEILQRLRMTGCKLILALHPGLHRPPKTKRLTKLSRLFWNIRNFYDSWKLFTRLKPFANVYRVNLNRVKRPIFFALLTLAGNHEYFLIFDETH